jgi:hypothetical protein
VFPANVRLDWKVLASTNALAYLASLKVTKGKFFYNIDTWGQCYKTYFVPNLQNFCNKQECLSLASLSDLV